jgi:hypothetical protein
MDILYHGQIQIFQKQAYMDKKGNRNVPRSFLALLRDFAETRDQGLNGTHRFERQLLLFGAP